MDIWYIVLVLPAIILSLVAQSSVHSTYKKYAQIASRKGITGAQAALNVLRSNGINDVSIVPISGSLTDNFNPKTKQISLSEGVYASSSVAALGIACHEAGHAVQHATGYSPIKWRTAVLGAANIGSTLSMPLIILGFILSSMLFVEIGIILFGFVVVFHLVTLPVEFNASRRAVKALESGGMLSSDELDGTKKVLRAAAMTYVASFAVSLAQFLRFILIFSSGRRRK